MAFSAASTLTNADGYIILRRQDATNPDGTGVTDGVAPASLSLTAGTTLVTNIASTATTTYNNTGLSASQQYNYCIIAYGWDGVNAATYNYRTVATIKTANATTLCTTASLPYSQGFNAATIPACWSSAVVADPGTDPALTYVTTSTSPTTNPSEGTYFVKFNSFTSASGAEIRLVSPAFTTTGLSGIFVSFDWFESDGYSTYTSEGATVQYSLDGGTNWTSVQFYQRYNATEQWTSKTCNLPVAVDNQASVLVGFLFHSQYGENCSLDDVLIDVATVDPEPTNQPTAFACGATTSTTIPLTWTAADAGSQAPDGYLLLWSTGSITAPVDLTAQADGAGVKNISYGTNAYTVTGLTQNTTYNFQIWSYTNSGANINYKLIVAGPTTSCATLTGPCHTEGMEAVASSGSYLSPTWAGDGGTWSVTNARTDYYISGARGLTFSSTGGVLTSPTFADGIGSLTISAKFPFSESSGTLTIAVNGSTVGTVAYAEMSGSTAITKTISGINIGGSVVVTVTSSTARFCIDDINWTCYTAGPNLVVSPTSLTSYVYAFGSGPSASQSFNLSGTMLDGTQVTITAPTNYEVSTDNSSFGASKIVTYIAPTLSSTPIYVRLKAGLAEGTYNNELVTCNDGGTAADVTVSNSGTVLCAAKTIPYSQNFDADDCWTTSGTSGVWARGDQTNDSYGPPSGHSGNTVFGTNLNTTYPISVDAYLVTPIFDLSTAVNPKISFWMDMESEEGYDGGAVQISVNGGTWTTVEIADFGGLVPNESDVSGCATGVDGWSGLQPVGEWSEVTLELFALSTSGLSVISSSDDIQVRFWFGSDASTNAAGWYIDDFTLTEIPVLPEPTNHVTAFTCGTTTSSSIPLTWTDDVAGAQLAEAYLIKWSSVSFVAITSPVDGTFVNDGAGAINVAYGVETVTIPDLNPLTTYYFKIFPYTNLGVNVAYKTGGTIPQTSCATLELPNIFISEYAGKGYATSSADEYIELTNLSASSQDLTGWTLEYYNSTSALEATATLTGTLAGNSAYLIGKSGSGTINGITPNVSISFFMNSTGYAILKNDAGQIIDQAGSSSDKFADEKNYEFTNCEGDNLPVANWDDLGTGNGTPGVVNCVCTTYPLTQAGTFGTNTIASTSMNVTWARGDGDRVIVIARASSFVNTDPLSGTTYTANSVFGSGDEIGTDNFVVYDGTGSSVSVTGLTGNITYYFAIYEYNSADNCYNLTELTGSATTLPKAEPTNYPTAFACGSATGGSITLTWTDAIGAVLPDGYLIKWSNVSYVAISSPSDGTFVSDGVGALNVAQGSQTGIAFNLLQNTQYYFKIFPYTNSGTNVNYKIDATIPQTTCTTLDVTVLYPADLAIVAVNTDLTDLAIKPDEICFIAFKDITANTAIDFTDNGYEREHAGLWGEGEGTIRLLRTGATITAGKTICFQGLGEGGAGDFNMFVCGVADDANWTISALNGINPYDLNVDDQIWIMQGGDWNIGGDHNADYTGNLLYGWTATGWKTVIGADDSPEWTTKGSILYPGAECFNTNVDVTTDHDKVKYIGSMTETDQADWITRINDDANWQGYSTNLLYDAGPDYSGTCIEFDISTTIDHTGASKGVWTGRSNEDWFNCDNWQDLQLPQSETNVTITVASSNNCTVDDGIVSMPEAMCNNITLNTPLRTFTLNNDHSVLNIYGNFTNNGTFTHSLGKVKFVGLTEQTISGTSPSFYNLELDKTGYTTLSTDITIADSLTLTNGAIKTGANTVYVTNNSTAAVSGNTNSAGAVDGYVEGRLQWSLLSDSTYSFPVGYSGYGAQGFDFTVVAGSGDVLAVMEPNDVVIDKQFAYCDIEQNDGSGTEIGDGTSGTDGLIDQIEFNLASPLQWNITNPSGSITEYNISDYANGAQAITAQVSVSGTELEFFMRNGLPDNPLDTSLGRFLPNFTEIGFIHCPNGSTLSGMTSFSKFTKHGATKPNTILPVELLFFDAVRDGKYVNVDWATANEKNNNFFTVERSKDANKFDFVTDHPGAGNSLIPLNYSIVDYTPFTEKSYYRLKQTDFDGKYSFSKIVAVEGINDKFDSENINIAKVENAIQISIENSTNSTYYVELVDMLGRVLFKDKYNSLSNKIMIDIDNRYYSKGIYNIAVYNESTIKTSKIVIE